MHSSFGKLLVSKWCESEDSFDAVHCWTPLYGIGFTFILPQGIAASEIMIVDGKMSLLTRLLVLLWNPRHLHLSH